MFSKPENFSVKTPIKPCNAMRFTLQSLNPNNLSNVHKCALFIHPEWLNGFNAALKKSIGINKNVCCTFGLSSRGLNGVQFNFNYLANNERGSLHKWPTIRFGVNSYEKLAKFSICYQPVASFRLKFNNQISIPKFGYRKFDDRLVVSACPSSTLHADWFWKSSKISFSATSTNKKSNSANLSFLMKATPSFVWGAELNYNQGYQISLEPCLTIAYLKRNVKLAGSVWPHSQRIDISCFKRIGEHFQSGSIFQIDVASQEAVGTVLCQYQLDDSVIRAKIASNGLIGATYEIKLWNFSITNSIVANFSTKNIIYGMKLGMD